MAFQLRNESQKFQPRGIKQAPGVKATNPTTPQTVKNNSDLASAQKKLQTPPVATAVQPTPGFNPSVPQISPTTASNLTAVEKIPGMNKELEKLSSKQVKTDANGVSTYTDGTVVPEDDYREADTESEDASIMQFLNQMKQSVDQDTKRSLDAIQQKMDIRREQQNRINQNASNRTQAALRQGGTSRYAPTVSSGVILAQESYGIQQLAALDAEESDLIANAYAAKTANDWKLVEQSIGMIQEKRTEKIKFAAELNKKMAEQNLKMAEEARQVEIDTNVANLFNEGVTKPADILQKLNDQGFGVTAEDVATAVKSYQKNPEEIANQNAITELVSQASIQEAPPELLQKASVASTPLEAALILGKYAGDMLKTELLREQIKSEQAQRSKIYNDIKQSNATGGGGLTPAQINSTVNSIAGAFDNEIAVKDYNTIKRQVETFNSLGTSATDDMQRVYSFAKIADPNSAVKEGEYDTIEKYSQALLKQKGIKLKRVFTDTGVLSPEARTAMEQTIQSSLNASKINYDQVSQEYQRQIDDAYAGKPRTITDYTGSPTLTPEKAGENHAVQSIDALSKTKSGEAPDSVWDSFNTSIFAK